MKLSKPTLLVLGALLISVALLGAQALAASQSIAVPTVAADPSLDPSAAASSWAQTAALSLHWDVVHSRAAEEPTEIRVATDGKFLYVRFDATQREPIVATQHSNDVIVGGSGSNTGGLAFTDDSVWVDLWPTGPGGFEYQFEANPNGAHNEASSENAAFAPAWESRGAAHDGGYTVTMAIPLNVIHGAHSGTWRAQFVRYVRATGAEDVWSYDPAQSNPDDSARAGSLTMSVVATRAERPKPRLALYALGSMARASAGGSTSRVGADLSIPVAAASAFFATFHPDYSNVELDQQTISPSVYQRSFSEVRPFFTQASSYYDDFNCSVCGGFRTTLYTPAIPTPAQGYAFEGKRGNFGLAAFDAMGAGRTDVASALDYTSPDTRWSAAFQHVGANLPGLVDDTNMAGVNWNNLKHLSAYANYATDAGTNVTDPNRAKWVEAGGGWGDQHFALFGSVRKVGAQFDPVDGFNFHPDVAGYGLYSARIWTFGPSSKLASLGIGGVLDRYAGTQYGQSQSDNLLILDVLTKSAIDVQLTSGSNYWRFGPTLTPISQNGGFSITYHSGMVTSNTNNFPGHGNSATPTQIAYSTGRYGLGRLDTWFRTSTIRVGTRGTLSLALDDTAQYMRSGPANVQWFESAAYAYEIGRNSSLAFGVRRVVGFPPQPNGGGNCEGVCSNVSFAYHLRLRNEEFYLAYGDPNTLVTVPQALFKIIFYAGGEKGT